MNSILLKVSDFHSVKYLQTVLEPLWTPHGIFTFVMIISWLTFLWESYLKYRQHTVAQRSPTVPHELVGVMDQETYNKARAYHIDRSKFSFICSLWEQLFQTAVLMFNGIPLLWAVSGRVTGRFGYGKEHEIPQTVMFALLASILNSIIDLPFTIYDTFVLEERHGFNKETPGFFIKDKIKKFIVMQAIMLPILACVVQIVRIGGDYFFIYLWLFCFVISLLLATVYADFIAPLFDKFTPVPEGLLKVEVEKLASSIKFPLKKLFIVEGSKRSGHSNAYYYGLFNNKRIVLYDTLLQNSDTKNDENEDNSGSPSKDKKSTGTKGCSNDEIVAVLAHELGHWKLNHTIKNLIIAQVNFLLCFMVFGLLFRNATLYQSFGFLHERPVIIGLLVILQYIFSPYHEIISFLVITLNRHFEFQADAFAKFLNKASDLRSALIKLNKDNLSFPVYDWMFSAWRHSHPPLLERIRELGKID